MIDDELPSQDELRDMLNACPNGRLAALAITDGRQLFMTEIHAPPIGEGYMGFILRMEFRGVDYAIVPTMDSSQVITTAGPPEAARSDEEVLETLIRCGPRISGDFKLSDNWAERWPTAYWR